MNVSGGSITEATISSLISSTTYFIQVAAVNSAGMGVYSDNIFATPDSECSYKHTKVGEGTLFSM